VIARRLLLGLLASSVACLLHTQTPARATSQPAPAFALPDQDGAIVTLDSLLARGPAVILFYRGHW
jgi:hypothetical protein